MYDYSNRIYPTKKIKINAIAEGSELFFTLVFTSEFVLKMLAMGFMLEKGSYLR